MKGELIHVPVETKLYELLGVEYDASEGEIKKAYRRKAKEQHPDKNINDPEASQKFQEMAAAYEILSDPDSRAVYDDQGMAGITGAGGPGNPADLFAQFFAAGNPTFSFNFGPDTGSPGRRGGKGDDSVIPHDVTLEDLYNGKSVKINMEKDVVCTQCKGSGARGNAKPKPCQSCAGKGWTHTKTRLSTGAYATSKSQCKDCKGVGERLKEKERCKKCKGEGVVKEKTRQEIIIDKGMSNHQRIVLAGAGDQKPGIAPGDVVFLLNANPHESFERNGNDLLTHVNITLSEALLGFSRIILTHLDGRGIKFSSPPGKIIKADDAIVLRGEGMPVHKQPDEKGNLYVIFEIEMPTAEWLMTANTKALEALLPAKRGDVDPQPEVVDEPEFEESDILDFGENEDGWEDDDEDEDEPDCRPQ